MQGSTNRASTGGMDPTNKIALPLKRFKYPPRARGERSPCTTGPAAPLQARPLRARREAERAAAFVCYNSFQIQHLKELSTLGLFHGICVISYQNVFRLKSVAQAREGDWAELWFQQRFRSLVYGARRNYSPHPALIEDPWGKQRTERKRFASQKGFLH